MTTYAEARDAEQLRILTPRIDQFIANYKDPAATVSTCRGQTVFFFPGGMASRLVRARQPYQEGVGVPPGMAYDPLWPDWDLVLGGWRKLKLTKDAAGSFRDHHDRIIVADGPLEVLEITPHDLFEDWCANHYVNPFIFGWDWRRRLDETADFFLTQFIPFFRERVMANNLPDPMADFSLVGHSFGGMVVNLIARSPDPLIANNMAAAVTIGTPSYGYSGQAHRWFEGEPWLCWAEVEFFGALGLDNLVDATRHDMLEVIASLPALYTVNFLDELTYQTNQAAFLADNAAYRLGNYPSKDMALGALNVDAYNPQTNGMLGRYPGNTGFDHGELAYGLAQLQRLASPLPAGIAQRFFNLRGVMTDFLGQEQNSTVGSLTWDWVAPGYDPSGPSPITDGAPVRGDDTHAAWSARLVNAGANVATVRGPLMWHACEMNHPLIMLALGPILCPPAPNPRMRPTVKRRRRATDEEVKDLLRWIYEHRDERKTWPPIEGKSARRVLPPRLRHNFEEVITRLFTDLVRGPVTRKKPQRTQPDKAKRTGERPRRATRKRSRKR